MTILFIPKPDLPKAYRHETTDWEIATSPLFKSGDIVASSRDDEVNLTSIIFDIALDTEKTYYSRARVVCDKAIFEWSKTDILKPTDFIKVAFNHAIPSMVMKPTISLDFDPMNFPSTLFEIKTTDISTTSNAEHESSSYIIEDMSGTPNFVKLDDNENLTSKLISEVKLEEGRPYVLKVAHKATSNDVSDFASQLVYVRNIKEIVLKSATTDPSIVDGYNVNIAPVDSFLKMYVKLIAVGYGSAKELYNGESDELNLVIPEDVFTLDTTRSFVLAIEVEKEDSSRTGIKYIPVKFS
jgi:hypothetical protein